MNEQWMVMLVQLRKRYTTLNQVYDLTVQMGQALDRNDQTSFSILLSMRQEPILTLQEQDKTIERICEGSPPDIQARWKALCRGEAAENDDESRIADQLAQNRRLIDRLVPLDQRLQKVLSVKKA